MFAWLFLRGRLKTRVFLARFLNSFDKSCPLCGSSEEDLSHLFSQCSIASAVWSIPNHIPKPSSFASLDCWISAIFNSNNLRTIEDCILLCWKIWKARNDAVFRGSTPSAMSIVAAAAIGAAFRAANPKNSHAKPPNTEIIKWIPPVPNWLKLNFDGAASELSAAAGFVIRNHLGHPVLAGALKLPSRTAIEAKASTLLEGLKAAASLNCEYIVVEGDAATVIQCVKDSCPHPWKIKSQLREISRIASSFKEIKFSHIFREANFLADALAALGYSLDTPALWWDSVPPQASSALALDASGVGRPRGARL